MPSFRPTVCSAQAQLLLDFGIGGDGLFRFVGERHPDAGHVDHDRHRAAGQRAARLVEPVGPPVGRHHRLRDRGAAGLELQRHAIGVAEHRHRLPFAEIDVLQGVVQTVDVRRFQPAGRDPRADGRLAENLSAASAPSPAKVVIRNCRSVRASLSSSSSAKVSRETRCTGEAPP